MMLRNLIMGLLLANLLVLAWGQWIVPPEFKDPLSLKDANEPELVLVNSPAVRPESVTVAVANESSSCYRLGPFESIEAAERIGNRLSDQGVSVEQTTVSGQIWVGHWVQLTGQPSIADARQTVDELARGGIRDAYIYNREPSIDISLGVYRSREGADDIIRRARKIGYEVEASDRFRDGIEHWVQAELPANAKNLRELARIGSSPLETQIMRIEETDCVETVMAGRKEDGEQGDLSIESPPLGVETPE